MAWNVCLLDRSLHNYNATVIFFFFGNQRDFVCITRPSKDAVEMETLVRYAVEVRSANMTVSYA